MQPVDPNVLAKKQPPIQPEKALTRPKTRPELLPPPQPKLSIHVPTLPPILLPPKPSICLPTPSPIPLSPPPQPHPASPSSFLPTDQW